MTSRAELLNEVHDAALATVDAWGNHGAAAAMVVVGQRLNSAVWALRDHDARKVRRGVDWQDAQ